MTQKNDSILYTQAAREVSRISNLSQKDIDSLDFNSRKILIIDTCDKIEFSEEYRSKLEKILKKNPYFCDINFTHFYGNNKFLITALSIYGKRIYYKIISLVENRESDIKKYIGLCDIIKTNYNDFEGFVIIHSYETICYTASFLSFMLENLSKIVVLTGSQLPIEVLKTDATSNLLNSLIFAGHFTFPEVLICFRDKIFRGNRSQTCDSLGFECISSPNFPVLANFGINISIKKNELLTIDEKEKKQNLVIFTLINFKNISDRCIVIKLNPFLTSEILINILNTPNIKGVVFETYGFGQITVKNLNFLKILGEAINIKKLIVVNISQAFSYNLESSQYGKDYEERGMINGGDMTLEASLAKLSYLIGKGYPDVIIKEKLKHSLKGEITSKTEEELFTYKENTLLQAITNPLENQTLYAESLEKVIFPSILSHVCKSGYLSLLMQLAHSTSILNQPESLQGKTPLHAATSQENPELIRFLIQQNCNVNAEDKEGKTPLFEAIKRRNKPIVKELVAAGAIIKGPKEEITSLLLNAAAHNDLDLIKLIFHAGLNNLNEFTNVDHRNTGHVAACENNVEIIKFLWKVVNFDFSEKDLDGRTPLDDAKFFKHEEIIKILDPMSSLIT